MLQNRLATMRTQSARPTKVMLAFIISPFISVAFCSLIMGDGMMFWFCLPVAYMLSIVLGLPVYMILRAFNWLNIWVFQLAAYLVSLCGMLLFILSFGGFNLYRDWQMLFFAPYHLITLFSALIFWCIAVETIEDNEPAS